LHERIVATLQELLGVDCPDQSRRLKLTAEARVPKGIKKMVLYPEKDQVVLGKLSEAEAMYYLQLQVAVGCRLW
jgi:hypothetical protein